MTEPSEGDPAPLEWLCFHCGELFTDRLSASDHFGLDETEPAACIQILTETERALVEDRREWRNRALESERENESLGHQLNSEKYYLRQFGENVRTAGQAHGKFSDERAARRSAEEKIKWLVQRMRDHGVPWECMPHEDRTEEEVLKWPTR